jgi:hypothetical protein
MCPIVLTQPDRTAEGVRRTTNQSQRFQGLADLVVPLLGALDTVAAVPYRHAVVPQGLRQPGGEGAVLVSVGEENLAVPHR